MAKQSGLHQIRGKVGEHSYYKQTGVSAGLIRSINQGMSARVKTSEEYANTRLNNQEFGAAANTAGLLGKMVVPKFRPMILPFSQSKMAKEILRLARENAGNWGERTIQGSQTAQLAAVLSAQSKRNATEFVALSLDFSGDNDFDASVSYASQQADLMASLGITDLTVEVAVFDLATGNWSAQGQQMLSGYMNNVNGASLSFSSIVAGGSGEDSETLTIDPFVPASGHSGHQIAVFVVLPARRINSIPHIMQEYCSFYAIEVPARL